MPGEDPKVTASMNLEKEGAHLLLNALGIEVEKPTPDNISGALADHIVRMYQQELIKNGSVVTGTGIESINSEHFGTGVYGIMIASYLDQVDEGRDSGNHPPVAGNERLTAWADKHGVNPYALAKHIADHGTKPHPFKESALDRARSEASDIVETESDKLIDRITERMG